MFSYLILLFLPYVLSIVYIQPEQIHLSFGDDVSSIIVTWSTKNLTSSSVVEYGIDGLQGRAFGSATLFVDGGPESRSQYIHRVTLTNLLPEETYYYHCGSNYGWSAVYDFKTLPKSSNWSPSFAIFGDLGNVNTQSLSRLQKEVQNGRYDAILHVGDFAYDLDSDNGRVGDEFMKQIEPIAAYLPYMTCPGNHEEAYNFSNYRARFSMPGLPDKMFYSYNIGPAHFISINTEAYYFLNYGLEPLTLQYTWLEKDLQNANMPENRRKHPWIITYGHRPMYCSNSDGDDCTQEYDLVRKGLTISNTSASRAWGLEKLFYKYGVDLEIWAHEHTYERLWPVYDGQVYNGSMEAPYTNPKVPVHFVTGSAGCQEGVDHFIKNPSKWSAFRSSDYGYTRLKVHNNTHLYFEQVSDDKNGEVIDKVWLVKNMHGRFSFGDSPSTKKVPDAKNRFLGQQFITYLFVL